MSAADLFDDQEGAERCESCGGVLDDFAPCGCALVHVSRDPRVAERRAGSPAPLPRGMRAMSIESWARRRAEKASRS